MAAAPNVATARVTSADVAAPIATAQADVTTASRVSTDISATN